MASDLAWGLVVLWFELAGLCLGTFADLVAALAGDADRKADWGWA